MSNMKVDFVYIEVKYQSNSRFHKQKLHTLSKKEVHLQGQSIVVKKKSQDFLK